MGPLAMISLPPGGAEGSILSLPSRRDGSSLPPPDYPRNQREKCWDEP
jgi:hypothetical protein